MSQEVEFYYDNKLPFLRNKINFTEVCLFIITSSRKTPVSGELNLTSKLVLLLLMSQVVMRKMLPSQDSTSPLLACGSGHVTSFMEQKQK